MKQKDFLLIAVVVIVSAVVAVVISGKIITTPKNRQQEVEVVTPISSEFSEPNKKYFNAESVNPTQLIQIGNGENTQPFNGSGQ
jgi:hypothetical protein